MAEPAPPASDHGSGSSSSQASSASAGHSGSSVDIEKLADKVYQLMLEEIRLARARGQVVGT